MIAFLSLLNIGASSSTRRRYRTSPKPLARSNSSVVGQASSEREKRSSIDAHKFRFSITSSIVGGFHPANEEVRPWLEGREDGLSADMWRNNEEGRQWH